MGVILKNRAVWTVMAVLLAVSLYRMALRQLARDPRFLAVPSDVSIAGPKWGGEELVAPVSASLRSLGPVNLFRNDFADRVRRAVEEVPGVARVDEIRRHWPNRYSVAFTLHRPVALVAGEGGALVPVTWDRVALDPAPSANATRRLLMIEGVRVACPDPGEAWPSERLADGLAALAQVGPHLRDLSRLGIHAIDVSRSDRSLEGVMLLGHDGLKIRWGRPRAEVGENSVERKIEFLAEVARYVEHVRGMVVDIRWDELYVMDPAEQ